MGWYYKGGVIHFDYPSPYNPIVDDDGLPHCGSYNCWCDGSCFPDPEPDDWEDGDDDEED